jgi:hypothetical protein
MALSPPSAAPFSLSTLAGCPVAYRVGAGIGASFSVFRAWPLPILWRSLSHQCNNTMACAGCILGLPDLNETLQRRRWV